ncbi:MAG: hypothetical protein IKJ09_04085 [Bacteroidaceae bacterium]|nr:hypothetical protein [Bacteroidaceae bacterium]
MMTVIFQQALVDSKSVLLVHASRLSLPTLPPSKGYDTPYLRRRMHRRMRGLFG